MSDSETIRSLAVHQDDVVRAHEVTLRTTRSVVLRVTPPFTGRKRARIHEETVVSGADAVREQGKSDPIHIEPAALLNNVPSYPEPDDTVPGETHDVESHHDKHEQAVASWRATIGDSIVNQILVDSHGSVDVYVL